MVQLLKREKITDAKFAVVGLELPKRPGPEMVGVVQEAVGALRIVGSGSSLLKQRSFLIANDRGEEIIKSMFPNACDAMAYAASPVTASLRRVVTVPGSRVRIITTAILDVEDTIIVSKDVSNRLTGMDRDNRIQSGRFCQIRGLLGRRFLKGTCRIAIGRHEKWLLDKMGVDVLVCEGSHKGDGDPKGDLILGTINYPKPFVMPGSTTLTLAVIQTLGHWAKRGLVDKSLLKDIQTIGLDARRKFTERVDVLEDQEKLQKLIMGTLFHEEEEEEEDLAARLGDAFAMMDVGFHPDHQGWGNLGFVDEFGKVLGRLHPRQRSIIKTWARRLRAIPRSFGLEFQGAMVFTHPEVDEYAEKMGRHIVVSSRLQRNKLTVGIRHPVRSAHGAVEFLTVDAEDFFGFKLPKGAAFISKQAALEMDGDFDGDLVGFLSTTERPVRHAMVRLTRVAKDHEPVPPTGKEEGLAEIWVGPKKDLVFSRDNLASEMANRAVFGADSMGLQTLALQKLFLDRVHSTPDNEHVLNALRRGQARLQADVQGLKKVLYSSGDHVKAALDIMVDLPDWLGSRELSIRPSSVSFESEGIPTEGTGPMQHLIEACNVEFSRKQAKIQILPMSSTIWRDFLSQLFLERFNWTIPWHSIHGYSLPQAFDQAFQVWREGTTAIRGDQLLTENTEARLNRFRLLRDEVKDIVTPVWDSLSTRNRGGLALALWKMQHSTTSNNDGGYLAACGCLHEIISMLQPPSEPAPTEQPSGQAEVITSVVI